jgi:hypothetical protein
MDGRSRHVAATGPTRSQATPAPLSHVVPGQLVEIDGCDHHWFEERGPACALLVYVDDATDPVRDGTSP